jgi:hypothetical protein
MKIERRKNPDDQIFETGRAPTDRRLRTVRLFCEEHPAFTQGSLRWLLFNRVSNGLERSVVKIGRRVLIDTDAFFAWINEQNGRQ